MERPNHSRTKSRTFSFRSDKSHGSKTSSKHPKESLKETAAEKRRSHFSNTTKANPNAAMNEAQPIAAALEAPTLASLRSIQHSDRYGNVIAEPDLSNPTRPRWERPLDTIRSFEAAIDTEYKRRTLMRAETTPSEYQNGYNSRRSSYYGGPGNDHNPRYSQGTGYYGTRTASARDGYLDNSYGGPPVAGPSRNRYGPRTYTEPPMNRYPNNNYGGGNNTYGNTYGNSYAGPSNVYPTQGYHQSRDTVDTGGSSGSEPWTNSTDPSSENSSIERTTPVTKQPDLGEQYGFTGFGGGPILEEYNNNGPPSPPSQPSQLNGNSGFHPGVAPEFSQPKFNSNSQTGRLSKGPPRPLAATDGNTPAAARPALQHQDSGKRKSWFKRRFSKA